MNEPMLTEKLRELQILEGIPAEALERIASVAHLVEFRAGDIIFREGAPAEDIYLITSGSVSLEICAPSVGCERILTVETGDLLSWSPLLGHEKLTATARALVPTSAVKISGRQVLALCAHDAHFGYEFMRRVAEVLAQRLKATRLQLLNIYGHQT
jgi:CRP-like cAMP-binding protein